MPDEPSRPKFSPAAKPAPVKIEARTAKNHVRPPSRPPTSRKHAPVVVTGEVPEARSTSETNDERQRLLRRYEKRESGKKQDEWNWRTGSKSGWIIVIVGWIIITIYRLFIREP